MGGKSGGTPKMRVTRYYLSGHWGICQGPVDAVKAIWVGEKRAWFGNATSNSLISIAKEKLFGGQKKEGGVAGRVHVLLGDEDQVAPGSLVSRLGRPANETPGFRGVTSLFFYGSGRAFYWGTQPYLKSLWVTVQRIPARTLAPGTAPIPRGSTQTPTSIYFELDDSSSMSWDSAGNQEPPPGTSRLYHLQQALHIVLDQLDIQVSQGQRIDLGMSLFLGGKLERKSLTSSGVDDFRLFVDGITTATSGGTPFDAPINDAVNWFSSTENDESLVNRINFFITDGEPQPPESATTAQDLAQPLLDREIDVDMWGINIDLQDTSATAKLHNISDPVPIVSGGNSSELASIIKATLFDIFDANPAHIIYECLTNTDWGMGAEPSSIDTASFQEASVTLYQEAFGLFLQWQAQSSVEDFINDVLEHIKGALYPNPRTGKMTLRLLRDDLDVNNLKEITPDNANMASFSRKGWGETTNEVVVTWTRPETEKEETIRMQDLANIAQQGGVVSSSKNYHGIRTQSLATRVAERDLREESAPLSACEVEVDREFWDTTPYDGVKMTWPEYGLNSLVMRVMKVNYGDSKNSVIKLSLMEDVFSLSSASFVAPADGEWQEPGGDPVPVATGRLMPAPAYVVSNNGTDPIDVVYPATALVPLPTNPTTDGAARYDVLEQVTTASGDTVFEEATGDRPFPGEATLDAAMTPEPTTTGVLLLDVFGQIAAVDELVILGDAALPVDELELALVTAIDENTGTLTLLRGVLDTVPMAWAAGTTVTITSRQMWRLLPREYVDGQSVTLRFLTSTSSGMLEEDEAPDFVGTALARASMPIRPANVQINGAGIVNIGDQQAVSPLVVTWSHRNRLLEDAVMYAWDAASLPPETGVAYRVEADALAGSGSLIEAVWWAFDAGADDTATLDLDLEDPLPTGTAALRFRVVAVRGDEENWQTAALDAPLLVAPDIIDVESIGLFAPEILAVEAA